MRCQLRVCNLSIGLDRWLAAGVIRGEDDLEEVQGREGGCEELRPLLDFVDFEDPENETLWPDRPLRSTSFGLVHVNFFSGRPTLGMCWDSMMICHLYLSRRLNRGTEDDEGHGTTGVCNMDEALKE